ncbi:MAG: HAMP domain-containing histidine kinase [Candidatus Firestonebacteria bacterium]|nr:HAMP domain-containing histidine kinase [Candidatus Firestonebacteria bacterium]
MLTAQAGKFSEFLIEFSHELSQPLASMHFNAMTAGRLLGKGDSRLQSIFRDIITNNQRVNEVLRLFRDRIKAPDTNLATLDVNRLIVETVGIMGADARARKVTFKTNLEPYLPSLRGDRSQLQQVLVHLIDNSLDALEKKQGSRQIGVQTARQADGRIRVSVTDNGGGISPKNLRRDFSAGPTRKAHGLGVGLALCRALIETHGGVLQSENSAGKGTIMTFSLSSAPKIRP